MSRDSSALATDWASVKALTCLRASSRSAASVCSNDYEIRFESLDLVLDHILGPTMVDFGNDAVCHSGVVGTKILGNLSQEPSQR